jgi:hypothetical protein
MTRVPPWSTACLAIACSHSEPGPALCDGTCVADPVPHCVQSDPCRDTSSCPSGLTCAAELSVMRGPCSTAEDAARRCRWRTGIDTTALAVGFGAQPFLAAGCWAYDDYHIIAASDLVPIVPDDYARVSPSFRLNEDCSTSGVDCYDRAHNFFGRCAAGHCQSYCITPEDCDLAAQEMFQQPKQDTCNWGCVMSATSNVGGCVPR